MLTTLLERPFFQSNSEIAIHVPDLARAETFYSEVMGFQLIGRTQDMLEFDTGRIRLYVNRSPYPVSYIPSFDVKDRASAARYLIAAGCKHEQGYFTDPFGFIFDVIERS